MISSYSKGGGGACGLYSSNTFQKQESIRILFSGGGFSLHAGSGVCFWSLHAIAGVSTE